MHRARPFASVGWDSRGRLPLIAWGRSGSARVQVFQPTMHTHPAAVRCPGNASGAPACTCNSGFAPGTLPFSPASQTYTSECAGDFLRVLLGFNVFQLQLLLSIFSQQLWCVRHSLLVLHFAHACRATEALHSSTAALSVGNPLAPVSPGAPLRLLDLHLSPDPQWLRVQPTPRGRRRVLVTWALLAC